MILYFVLIFINAELSVVLHEVIIYTLLYLSASLYISCNNVNALSPQSAINSIASINIYSGLFSNHRIASSTSQSHNSFTFFPVDKFSARVTNTYSFSFNSFLHTTDLPEPAFPCIDTNFSRPACIVLIISDLSISYSPLISSSIFSSSISLLISIARKNFLMFSLRGCSSITPSLSIILEKSDDSVLCSVLSPLDIRDFVYSLYAYKISSII